MISITCGLAQGQPAPNPDVPDQELRRRIQQEQAQLRQARERRASLHKRLREAETALGKLHRQILQTEEKMESLEVSLRELDTSQQQLQNELRQRQSFVRRHLREAYQQGHQPQLRMLLDQQNPSRLSRLFHYYHLINQAHSKKIREYRETLTELQQVNLRIASQNRVLGSERSALQAQRQQLQTQQDRRQQVFRQLEQHIRNRNALLESLLAEEQELKDLVSKVRRDSKGQQRAADIQSFEQRKGQLAWPVKGSPQNRFGAYKLRPRLRWQGLRIQARRGEQVKAIHRGRIAFADWFGSSGLLVIIDHGNGFMSLYAHNQTLLRSVGDWIDAGDTIATVGNSGGQDQPSLYLEIRQGGQPMDPLEWLTRG